jgi:hypothetical protein
LVWWLPGSGSYTVQTNANLSTGTWIGYGGAINNNGGTNRVVLTPTVGNVFFRMYQP